MKQGTFYDTRKLKVDGIETTLRRGYVHKVLLLDTVDAKFDYQRVHAIDCMNSLGWCTFDSIKACLGEKAAKKMIAFCEARVREMVAESNHESKQTKETK